MVGQLLAAMMGSSIGGVLYIILAVSY